MKILIFSILLFLSTCSFAHAQKVEVSQDFVDSSSRAFSEVIELRKVVEAYKAQTAKTDVERQSADALIKAMNDLMSVKDATINQYQTLTAFQQTIIKFQQDIISQMQQMAGKKKSGLDKFLHTLKEIAILSAGILIGRGAGL